MSTDALVRDYLDLGMREESPRDLGIFFAFLAVLVVLVVVIQISRDLQSLMKTCPLCGLYRPVCERCSVCKKCHDHPFTSHESFIPTHVGHG